MVHGRDREEVEQKVAQIIESCGLQDIEHTILFSTRRFKQRGASYTPPTNKPKPAGHLRLKLVKEASA
jgi:hypothetical protein